MDGSLGDGLLDTWVGDRLVDGFMVDWKNGETDGRMDGRIVG
jgi:hypothetical protein